ncbi:shikimate kinase [Aliibacillus thermotolerans]|uniref:Shikimate kinase n=1 Tax=Aliibacillus thermotolerans TaxID=1834418 RepID=A0ABW0U6Y6_9BACI|nr:shikimate kinase [Aliibacillus thermotolerans]MDA3130881.1 shikimate kinase [Aliibacillus thermotolerans]
MRKNIVLVGFMGTGKSTVGKLLAEQLNRTFYDMDDVIVEKEGKSVAEIFSTKGERYFREVERKWTINYCTKKENAVVALGGGAFVQAPIREACLAHTEVVLLSLSWETWVERMEELKEGRPLLQEKNVKEIRNLFEERATMYAEAHHRIVTDGFTPEEVTEQIIALLQDEMQE